MGVIRVEHNSNYTTMANYHLRDARLSLRAVGLMSKMLSLPDDWDYTVKGLAAICTEGREAVRKVLMELEEAGYLVREQSRSSGGVFSGYDYTLHEAPTDPADGEAPLPGILGDGEAPLPEKPDPGFPVPGFPSQSNTEESSKQESIPPISPQGAGADYEPSKTTKWKPERFDAFWKFYPLHKSKQAAIKAWDKLKPSDELLAVIGKALMRQIADEEEKAKKDRRPFEWKMHASTYLNNARWTDEIGAPQIPQQSGGFSGWANEPEAS